MSGKTIIRLQIGELIKELPLAITICFSTIFSMERSTKFYPVLKKYNTIYQDLLKNYSKAHEKWYKAEKIYQDIFNYYASSNLKNNGLDMNKLFDEMSIKNKALYRNNTIWLRFYGKTLIKHITKN